MLSQPAPAVLPPALCWSSASWHPSLVREPPMPLGTAGLARHPEDEETSRPTAALWCCPSRSSLLAAGMGCKKNLHQHPQGSSHRQRPGRPRGPWEDKGRKREGGREINNFLHSRGLSPSYKKHMVPDTIFSSTVTWSIWRLVAVWRAVVKHSLLVTHTYTEKPTLNNNNCG